jgi:probable F420-dependent oxidoreductase
VTTDLRLAITVLDNDFRHPVMVAKEVATLDVLSGGRVDVGLGAGWLEEDYTKTGIAPWDPAKVRVERLGESIRLLKELLGGEPVTFAGEYYQVEDFRSLPAPAQAPVPLIVGVRGRRMLALAAKEAQVVSILARNAPEANSLAGFEQQLHWIREADGYGRDDLEIGLRIPLGEIAGPGETSRAVIDRFAAERGMAVDVLEDSPFCLVGDLARVRDHLVRIHEQHGVSYVTVSEDLAWQVAPILADLP